MTPEELRIRCAELDGWRNVYLYEDNAGPSMWVGDPPSHRPLRMNQPDRHIPNFCYDLNDINAAVLRLSDEKLEAWEYALEEELFGMMNQALRDDPGHRAALATASAIERATAFAAIHSK